MSTEIWRDVPGFEGLYEVSNRRRIRTVERLITRSNGMPQTIRARIRRLRQRRGGPSVTLVRNGERRSLFVHKLARAAFADEATA